MKRGFTLVEMLVVVVVLVTLMSMTFKLTSLGKNEEYRTRTIARLQRLENCLSGYYAAFGTYPPVKLHGRRNIYLKVNSHDIQDVEGEESENIWGWYRESAGHGIGTTDELKAWRQVRAACRAQPVGCAFPFPDRYKDVVSTYSAEMQRRANSNDDRYSSFWSDPETKAKFAAGYDDGVSNNSGRHDLSKTEWRELQLFKFGLMSFLLPRYLVMMNGDDNFFRSDSKQWYANNQLPCDPFTGEAYNNWTLVRRRSTDTKNKKDYAAIANMPSQAVTARWMPNLEGICACNHEFTLYGISIRAGTWESPMSMDNAGLEIYSPGGNASGSTSDQYILDEITVKDGWGYEFFYYSPAPYQTYTVWSGGLNHRTFPPWIDRAGMEANANKCIGAWTEDDIIHMSN